MNHRQKWKSYHIRFDLDKPTERAIAEAIPELKHARKWQYTLRTGIIMALELAQGKTDTLVKEYPDIAHKLAMEALAAAGQDTNAILLQVTSQDKTTTIEAILERQFSRLEQRILGQETVKLLAPVSRPVEADDRLELTIEEAKTDQNPGKNLQITTTLAMGGENSYLLLPLETLEYGLRMGDLGITEAMVAAKKAQLAAKNGKESINQKPVTPLQIGGSAKALEGAELEFQAPPDLDELDW